MLYFSTLLYSLFITMALIPILRRNAVKMNCVDQPGERKVHCAPIPKVGGLAMAVGIFVPMLFVAFKNSMAAAILIGCAIIVLFGWWDDVKDLGYRSKFGAQLAAALVVVFFGGLKINSLGSLMPEDLLLPGYIAIPLTVLIIIGITNAVNLSDGLDGLAGGIMLLSFLCIAFLAYRLENRLIALMTVATTGAIFGFLRYNTYPATIFMGDAGSQLLGFLAITTTLAITQGSATPISPFFPLLLLWLPILDTLMVMIERIAKGRSPFMADKNHLHHKLLRLNLYHSEAVFLIYVLQAGLVTGAYLLRYFSDWAVLGACIGFALTLTAIMLAGMRGGWRFTRPGVFDRIVKNKLKIHVRDRFIGVKISQRIINVGFPLLFIATCAIPSEISRWMTVFSLTLIVIVLFATKFKSLSRRNALRLVVFFFMPMVIYYSEREPAGWITEWMMLWYHLAFGILVFFAVTTLKGTRRGNGYKATPLDFIILFVAFVVPNLPGVAEQFHLGFMAAKMIAFFFVFEVLVGEMRGRINLLILWIITAIMVFLSKGLF